MTELKPGDKYLSIKLAGHDYVVAFKNEKTSPGQPDYKGDGVAVWVKTKQGQPKEETVVDQQEV